MKEEQNLLKHISFFVRSNRGEAQEDEMRTGDISFNTFSNVFQSAAKIVNKGAQKLEDLHILEGNDQTEPSLTTNSSEPLVILLLNCILLNYTPKEEGKEGKGKERKGKDTIMEALDFVM